MLVCCVSWASPAWGLGQQGLLVAPLSAGFPSPGALCCAQSPCPVLLLLGSSQGPGSISAFGTLGFAPCSAAEPGGCCSIRGEGRGAAGAGQPWSGFPRALRSQRCAQQVTQPGCVLSSVWSSRRQGQHSLESCTHGDTGVPLWPSHSFRHVGLPLLEQALLFPRASSPGRALVLPWALPSAPCPHLLLRFGMEWDLRLGGFGSPAPPLALGATLLLLAAVPLPAGWGGSFWGQWVLAAPAELFYLISSLLLPRSQCLFRAPGCLWEFPRLWVSQCCLLWDGSLSFCQEAASQQLAGGGTGTQQAGGGNWAPLALGAAAIPALLWAAQCGGSCPMAWVCLPGLGHCRAPSTLQGEIRAQRWKIKVCK